MRIFNEDKTKELIDVDLSEGYLRPDKLLIKHHEAIPEKVIKTAEEVKDELIAQGEEVNLRTDPETNEQKWYVVTQNYYRNGVWFGNDEAPVEAVIEPAQEAWDEDEDIQVYVPYTKEESAQIKIAQLKQNLFDTDYKAIKYAEGYLTKEEYAPIKAQRQAWRDEINALQEKQEETK